MSNWKTEQYIEVIVNCPEVSYLLIYLPAARHEKVLESTQKISR